MHQHCPGRTTPYRVRTLAFVALVAVAAAGCIDRTSLPTAYVRPAAGEMWVAVTPPAGLPDIAMWASLANRSDAVGRASAARVETLRKEATAAWKTGRVERSKELQEEALDSIVAHLAEMPSAVTLRDAAASLSVWLERTHAEVDLGAFPHLARAVAEVEHERDRTRTALAGGDTVAAMRALMRGAARIRSEAPAAVALRVLERTERRLTAEAAEDTALVRPLHLVRSARAALLEGRSDRALRRALYAAQLLDAREHAVPADREDAPARVEEIPEGR